LAVKNIESLVTKLDIDLRTIVIDWEEIRDLQVAFLKAGVANQDIPQDHAFVSAAYEVANRRGFRWILSGSNWATESILPKAWGYSSRDLRHLKAISRRFGRRKLRKYPTMSFFQRQLYYPYFRKIRRVKLLNYVEYNRNEAIDLLKERYGWRYYGGKHYESRYTKFFQGYYLPRKFGYDKRRAHLASLVASGQMRRVEALVELSGSPYPLEQLEEDRTFVLKKLRITEEEFKAIEENPNRHFTDYPSNIALSRLKSRVKVLINALFAKKALS
jgi:hypothetical protein